MTTNNSNRSNTSNSASSIPTVHPWAKSLSNFFQTQYQSLTTYVSANRETLKWRVPLALLILYLLHRRIRRTRATLFAARPPAFFQDSLHPPFDAPSHFLPSTTASHLLYSLLPLRVQHGLRDSGAFRALADYGAMFGGLVAFGWRPRVIKRMFGKKEGWITGVRYGERERQTLDVFWTHRLREQGNVSTDSSPNPATVSMMATSGASSATSSSASTKPLSPVLLWTHGGAWGSGSKDLYRMFMQQFDEQLNFVTLSINYSVYPDAKTDQQIADLATAVKWCHAHVRTYGGDPNRIYLMGHSSGAHCTSLYILNQIKRVGKLNVPIAGVIGLSGPYDIADHYEFEAARGVHEISPMKPANGDIANFAQYSATQLALSLTPTERSQLSPFLLLHGASDHTVPYASSVKFAYALSGGGFENAGVQQLEPLESHHLYHAPLSSLNQSSNSSTLRSITFPRTSPSIPLIHLRICGATTDPAQVDHASFIFDLMHTHTTASSGKDGGREVVTVGHTGWIIESIQAFLIAAAAANDRDIQIARTRTQPASSDRVTPSSIQPPTSTSSSIELLSRL